jgi:predicted amidohydrolase
MPMEWASPAELLNLAFVVNADGTIQGFQTKNQLAIEEEPQYVASDRRQIFVVEDVPFGIVICH